MRIRVHAERPSPRKLQPALAALAKGEVIILPTDTGYAFGCALSSNKGIAAIRRLKDFDDRSPKPLAMMVTELSDLGTYGVVDNRVFRMAKRILPGPYTIVLRASADTPRAMRNQRHEIGLRMPDHAICRMLVEEIGEPLLVGSVTRADAEPDLEDPEIYEKRFRGEVGIVIDAGPLWPEPSTILRAGYEEIEVLRVGQGVVPE